jgi:hypothetical protein
MHILELSFPTATSDMALLPPAFKYRVLVGRPEEKQFTDIRIDGRLIFSLLIADFLVN